MTENMEPKKPPFARFALVPLLVSPCSLIRPQKFPSYYVFWLHCTFQGLISGHPCFPAPQPASRAFRLIHHELDIYKIFPDLFQRSFAVSCLLHLPCLALATSFFSFHLAWISLPRLVPYYSPGLFYFLYIFYSLSSLLLCIGFLISLCYRNRVCKLPLCLTFVGPFGN